MAEQLVIVQVSDKKLQCNVVIYIVKYIILTSKFLVESMVANRIG